MGANGSTFSVIGADVTIRGDVIASTELHVDGNIEGDLQCAALVQGEGSRIEGGMKAESARLAGRVIGSITVRELVVLKSARIEGDVHYDALTIEQGAEVEGRLAHRIPNRRAGDGAEDRPDTRAEGAETGPVESRPIGEPKLSLAN